MVVFPLLFLLTCSTILAQMDWPQAPEGFPESKPVGPYEPQPEFCTKKNKCPLEKGYHCVKGSDVFSYNYELEKDCLD